MNMISFLVLFSENENFSIFFIFSLPFFHLGNICKTYKIYLSCNNARPVNITRKNWVNTSALLISVSSYIKLFGIVILLLIVQANINLVFVNAIQVSLEECCFLVSFLHTKQSSGRYSSRVFKTELV